MRGKDPGLIENMNNKMMKIKKDRDKIPDDDVPEVMNDDDKKGGAADDYDKTSKRSYDKKGVCGIHGKAEKLWRPNKKWGEMKGGGYGSSVKRRILSHDTCHDTCHDKGH